MAVAIETDTCCSRLVPILTADRVASFKCGVEAAEFPTAL